MSIAAAASTPRYAGSWNILVAVLIGALLLPACRGRGGTPGGASSSPIVSDPAAVAAALANPAYAAHKNEALGLYQRGDFRGALREAALALTVAPGAKEPYALVSKLYIDSGLDVDAVGFFDLAAKKFPSRPEPWFFKGFHQFRLNHWDDALASLERAAALDPNDPECWFRRGLILQGKGDFDGALAALERSYALDPAPALTAARLARLYRIAGRYEESERVLTQALVKTPDSAEIHYGLGQLRMRAGRDSDCEHELRRAIEIDPNFREAHYDLSRLLLRTGRKEEGQREERIAARLADYVEGTAGLLAELGSRPDDPSSALAMAELELTERRYAEALRWFARAEALGGNTSRIAEGRAEALFGSGNEAAGEEALASPVLAGDTRAGLARAVSLAVRGEDPLPALDRAVATGPNEREFLRRAADLYSQRGATDKADALLARAVSAPSLTSARAKSSTPSGK